MKRILLTIVFVLLAQCTTTKDLFIDNLKNSYELSSEKTPIIYYTKSGSIDKVKVATVNEIVYGKFGGKLLFVYRITIYNGLYSNPSEIVAWLFLTQKSIEQVDVKYSEETLTKP